jgi:putative oxidoreductase
MSHLARLILRLTTGGLLAGHGAQKLFGWFDGSGWRNTAAGMEKMNLRPGEVWGTLAGAGELGGGTLMALGFLNPLGPLASIGAMSMATAKAHWGKPIWATKGGAELPITNIAVASAILLAGPGKLSLDALFGTRLPRWLAVPGLAVVGAAVYTGVRGELPLPAEARARLDEALRSMRQSARQTAERMRQPRSTTGAEVPAPSATTSTTTAPVAGATATGTPTRAAAPNAAPDTTHARQPGSTTTPGTTSTMDELEPERPPVTGTH